MNKALKIIGPSEVPCIFISIISEYIFKFLWFVKSLEWFWLVTYTKNFFPFFTKITLSVGMVIYDKMQSYLFSCHVLIQILLRITDRWQAPQEFQKQLKHP